MRCGAGEEAHPLSESRDAIAKANEPKRLHWIQGASHMDLYDRYVPQVIAELIPFFTQNLAAQLAPASA